MNLKGLRDSSYQRKTDTQTADVTIEQLVDDQYVAHALDVLGPYQ